MSRDHCPYYDARSKASIDRKPSFRSELKIHLPKSPCSTGNTFFVHRSTADRLTSTGEYKIQRLPPTGSASRKLSVSKVQPERSLNPPTPGTRYHYHPDLPLYHHYQQQQQQQHQQQQQPQHPRQSPTTSPSNNLVISTPFVERCFREFTRSSSVHGRSFLYPRSDKQPARPPSNDLEGSVLPPDKSQDDSCIPKVVGSLRRGEKTKSTDHLLEEEVVQRRNDSFKSSEKRHSFCAIDSESDGKVNKPKRNNADTMSLKPGISSLSISKPNWFIKKYVERQESKLMTRRSASCRDLGGVDCEGWLWRRHEKSGIKTAKWILWWCVLEKKALKFFKDKESRTSEGSVYLPGMKVAPAPELNLKKGAFKAFHAGSTFYFRAEKREDMVKWMNKMSLATLSDFEVESSKLIAGFQNDEESDFKGQRSASSGSEDNMSSNCSSPSLSGEDIKRISRSSENLQSTRKSPQITHYQLNSKYIALNKLLKEKEEQLRTIDNFIGNLEITGEDLKRFIETQPILLFQSPDVDLEAGGTKTSQKTAILENHESNPQRDNQNSLKIIQTRHSLYPE